MFFYLFGFESFLEDFEEGGQIEFIYVVDFGEIIDYKVYFVVIFCQRQVGVFFLQNNLVLV